MATIFSPTIAINSNNLFSGTTNGCIVYIPIYLSTVGFLPLIQTLIASEEPTLYLRMSDDFAATIIRYFSSYNLNDSPTL